MSDSQAETTPQPLNVHGFLAVMTDQLAAIAWQKMGLQADPMTGKVERDLAQARVAIDVAESVAKTLESELDEEDKRQMRNLIRDLKVNYVEQSK
ncbi:MAG: DUF1844 domain-containing protein [Chthonomonas sp.]|nr:DUF1844 domain-containing protein [Chthonomonas sp.]